MASQDSLSSNPLLQNFDFPPFDSVDAHHVRPGIRALLQQLVRLLLKPRFIGLVYCVYEHIMLSTLLDY